MEKTELLGGGLNKNGFDQARSHSKKKKRRKDRGKEKKTEKLSGGERGSKKQKKRGGGKEKRTITQEKICPFFVKQDVHDRTGRKKGGPIEGTPKSGQKKKKGKERAPQYIRGKREFGKMFCQKARGGKKRILPSPEEGRGGKRALPGRKRQRPEPS